MLRLGNKGISEVVGTVILLAIAIIAFSAFAIYVLSTGNPSSSPDLNLVGYIEEEKIVIQHKGGEAIKLSEIRIIVHKGEMESFCCNFDKNGIPKEDNVHFSGDDNGRWELGEYVEIYADQIFGNITNWQISVVVVDKASNSIIMSGILQEGLVRISPPMALFTYTPLDPKFINSTGKSEIIIFDASSSYDPDGGRIVLYKWDFESDGITDAYGVNVLHRYLSTGIYYVTLTVVDDEGQTASSTTGIGVNVPPPVNVTYNKPPVGDFEWYVDPNIDGTINFYANVTDPDGEIVSYFWNFGDGSTSSVPNPIHTYQYSGSYTVTLIVTDDNGEQAYFEKTIVVPNILPIAGFSYSPRNITTVITVNFDGGEPYSFDKDGYIVEWYWDFGDGFTANGSTVSHKFTEPGNYTVTLTVVDNEGGQNSTSKIIRVYPKPAVSPPTFLIVDNTPIGWESGIDNIIQACQNIMPESQFLYAKAIDDWYFTNDSYTSEELRGQRIDDALINQFDIVIWSCGDFPGDGGYANYEPWLSHPNYWSTPMTEGEYWNDSSGGDDNANHVYELAQHLTGNVTAGTLLLCGTYVVRDLQNYPGNGVTSSEIWLGDVLGLIEPSGGIDYNPAYEPFSGRLGYTYFRGKPYYAAGILYGIENTSSGQIGVSYLEIKSPIKLYALHKKSDDLFKYSLMSNGSSWTIVLDEDFETNPGWTHGGAKDEWEWGVPTFGPPGAHSGSKVYGTDLDSWYQNNANCWLKTGNIDLSNFTTAVLEFYDWYYIVYGYHNTYDYVYLEISDDGGSTWQTIAVFYGDQRSWTHHTIDISAFAGKVIQIRWRLVSDWRWRSYGYYLDDVVVKGSKSSIPVGYYAIDAERGRNRSIILGFDLNADEITQESRENYLRNVLAWLAEGAGYATEVWVNNDATEEWLNQPNHFATIQEGINAVTPGGKVYVIGSSGQIYYEDVVLNKSIDLIGIDNPTIFASQTGIEVTIDWAKIEGFVIKGDLQTGILVSNSARVKIINCTISGANNGIYLLSSHNNTIQGNIIKNCTNGIFGSNSLGNKILNNDIKNNEYGLYLYRASLNTIDKNNISQNGIGLFIDSAESNIISNNTFIGNAQEGIYLMSSTNRNEIINNKIINNDRGIRLEISNTNSLINNTIAKNDLEAILIEEFSHTNTLRENKIYNNSIAISLQNSSNNDLILNDIYLNSKGISAYYSASNIIVSNTIMNNTYAINLSTSSNNNTIVSNVISGNLQAIYIYQGNKNNISSNEILYNGNGIYLAFSMLTTNGENIIANNNISFNNGTAICLYRSVGNYIKNNTILSNTKEGIKLSYLSSDNYIIKNIIRNNLKGVCIEKGNYNIIKENAILQNDYGIVLSSYSSENTILNNTIENNGYGMQFLSTSTNSIINNTIKSNFQGIWLSDSHNNKIMNNTISNNTQNGIYISSSDDNDIMNNTIYNNSYDGIYLLLSGGSGNTILNNTIFWNKNGIYLDRSRSATAGNNEIIGNRIYENRENGIYLYSSNINSIQNNQIYNNSGNGIFLNKSHSNTIQLNEIRENNLHGLYLYSSNNNDIQKNNISFNLNGIYILLSSQGDSLPITDNLIWNNSNAGILINSSNSNYIMHNIIWNNSYGIFVISSSTNNEVYENNITTNDYGIYVASQDCTANKFYYNNFINNTLHNDSQAYDAGNNSWYISTSGNYWNEHISTDPYIIPPGINQDKYPLLSPRKWWL